MAGHGDHYVWFENARVVGSPFALKVEVSGQAVPFPLLLLHPECALRGLGDVGRFGVPVSWAKQHGLCGEP